MSTLQTVVFADVVGSTSLFEVLGNQRATDTVTQITQWACDAVETGGGRVVKTLGDGVLGVFEDASAAMQAMAGLMRNHRQRLAAWPSEMRLDLRVGLASGEVVQIDGDCYGDAVNVASRLCERASPREIWATESAVRAVGVLQGVWVMRLGQMDIRGKAEPVMVYQVKWREEEEPDLLTMQAALHSTMSPLDAGGARIQFQWEGANRAFSSAEAPVNVGRATQAHLCVSDPRVSRLHARIDWRNGAFVLTDMSSFGTWVRFDGSATHVQLRRDNCLLHGEGEIALGVPFSDTTAPTIGFRVVGGSVHLG